MARIPKRIERRLEEIDRRADADGLLTAEDRERIKQKAREHVATQLAQRQKTQKAALEAEYLERAVRDEERVAGLHGSYADVTIDVAANAAYIMLDGTMYMHGLTYEVPEAVAFTLNDIMQKTYEHENETSGRPRRADTMRRPQARVISPRNPGVVNTRNLPVV